MVAAFVNVEPLDLVFQFEVRKQISSTLRLVNTTEDYVAYKVKTTSPKKYCVRPNTGVIPPKSSTEIIVVMQAQKEVPPDLICKDKFLVQTAKVPSEVNYKDVANELFVKDGQHEVQETKLKVVYVSPPPPPSPVAEANEEDVASPEGQEQTTRNSIQEVTSPEAHGVRGGADSDSREIDVVPKKKGFSWISVLLVVLAAFLIGYFFGQAPAGPSASGPSSSSI